MNDNINYYELLGVKKNATETEIKTAYRNQAKKWHPDINKDKEASNMTKQLNEAKQILLDKEKRKEYDRYLEKLINAKYENLKETKTNKDTKNYNTKTSSYYQEKTYTKWEYFVTYLKYYQTSVLRKVLAIILVLIETIFCSILQITNYLLVLVLVYGSSLLTYIISIVIGIYIMIIIFFLITKSPSAPQNIKDWVTTILIIFLGGFITILPNLVISFFIDKTPVYLSNLNIYLFKKAIGYKE